MCTTSLHFLYDTNVCFMLILYTDASVSKFLVILLRISELAVFDNAPGNIVRKIHGWGYGDVATDVLQQENRYSTKSTLNPRETSYDRIFVPRRARC